MANDQRARTGRDLIQRMRDNLRLSQAYLQLLECHGGPGGAAKPGALEANQATVSASMSRSQRVAQDDNLTDRRDMVNGVVGSWQPPRSYAGTAPGAAVGFDLEDPFA